MKRILSLILIFSMLIFPVRIAAAQQPEILLNEAYSDTPTNSTPPAMTSEGDGSVLYVEEYEGGKALKVKHRWADTSVRFNAAASEGIVWIDTKIKFCDNNTSKNVIEVSDSSSFALVKLSAAGAVSDYQGNSLCRVSRDEWHRFTAAVNLATARYDIYVDGIKRAQRAIAPNSLTKFTSVGFTAHKNPDEESVMYNAYMRVYRSKTLPDEKDFPAKQWDYTEKKLRKTQVKQVSDKAKLYYSESFEDIAQQNRPTNITATSGEQFVRIDEDGNHYYAASWDGKTSMSINFEANKIGASTLAKQFVMQADVRINKNSDDVWLFCLRDADNPYHFSQNVYVKANGSLGFYNGASLGGANCKNNWVNIAVVSDFETHKHDVYIDRQLVLSDVEFQDMQTINRISMFRFQSNTNTAKGNIQLDNIKIYSGNKPVTDEELESAAAQMPESEEIWEHEISAKPLNSDLRQFTKAEEYTSANPSKYLQSFGGVKNAFKDTVCLVANNSNIWIKDQKYSSDFKVLWEQEHFIAPAELLAALAGENAAADGVGVKIGSDFEARIGEKKITVAGTEYETESAVQILDGKIYLPVKEFVIYKLKKYYCETFKGLAVISDKQMNLKKESNTDNVIQMLAYLILDMPNTEKLQTAYEQSDLKGVHPRIYATKERYKEVLSAAANDEILKKRSESLKSVADAVMTYTFTYNKTSGKGSFSDCEALYWAWLMTGDEKYARKAEELALLIANDSEWWSGSYFLATAYDMMICATVYDLFYDWLSKDTKDILAKAVMEKGLKATQEHYNGASSDWPKRKTNWNTVCNGGAMVAASVFLGEGYDDALCLDVIEKSFISVSNELHAYAPYGGLFEGIGYWGYGHGYIIRAVEAYRNLFGTDYGISAYPGFMEAAYFPFYMETWEDKWPLHDDTLKSGINNTYASWQAYYNHDLMLQKMRCEQMNRKNYSADFLDVLYYIPEEMPDKIDIPLDKNYSYSELASSRSDWGKSAFYLGVHAGANNFEHGQQDLGNFIYEAFGVRFAKDIGRDSYDLPNYFNEGTTKLNYYVHRAEAHNVYVINPSADSGQLWRAKSEIEVLENKPKGIIYRVDMTPAYYGQLEEGIRGYMLTNDRSTLVVQDEIVPKESDDEYKWFWTTDADITINADNSVTLTRNYKTVTLYFDSNVDLEFSAGVTEPLPTSPNPQGQLLIGNTANKLTVTFVSDADKVYLRCTAVPYGHEYERGDITPVSEWTIPDGNIYEGGSDADMIYVNGTPIEAFDPDVYDYTLYYADYMGLPVVTADSAGTVSIRQAEPQYKTAVVTVTSRSGVEKIYTITFQSVIASGLPDGTRLEVKSVTAEDDDGNLPEYTQDNDLNTRWSGKTTDLGWIEFDLGEEKTVDAVALAVFNGNTRSAKFDIQVSTDGINYTTVVEGGATSGTTKEMEHVTFSPVNARYVKLIGHGASTSRYNSYTEIHIYKLN